MSPAHWAWVRWGAAGVPRAVQGRCRRGKGPRIEHPPGVVASGPLRLYVEKVDTSLSVLLP